MNKLPGNTKLIRLTKLEKYFNVDCSLFAKVENSNPSGSIKDRAVYQMLLDYQKDGKLKPGSTIIEATSGNTGISLAYFSKQFGYRCLIVMPSSMSKERREMISSLGAELVLTSGGMKEAEEKAIELVKQIPNSFIFDQFNNANNAKGHYLTTGPEILNQCNNVDYVFAGIGTGGTISGIGKFLKEYKENVKIIGVEPLESPLLAKGEYGPHKIQGIGANFVPNILDRKVIDYIEDVNGDKSIEVAEIIRRIEGIDVGISSGAALLAAINFVKKNKINQKNVVVIFPDKGDRYQWKENA